MRIHIRPGVAVIDLVDYWLRLVAIAVGYTTLAWFVMLALVLLLTWILYRTEDKP